LIAGSALAGAAFAAPDQARVQSGLLQGSVEGSVASFRGVPYAAPPLGPLRWRAPQPPATWTGVRPATAYGPACIQTAGASGYRGTQSEDCLTLNVWAPASRRGASLPVMVWIHGGGFVGGSGARYDGTHFAEYGVVLVTLNYRLGRLGFFAHPALAKANPEGDLADFGLMDQIAALKWVKANIAAFGGNPGNVTIFGESAGGMSVNCLLVSPLARGLFAKAISESGFGRDSGKTLAEAQKVGLADAKGLGVVGEDAKAAEAMRALPPEALAAPVTSLTDEAPPGPIIDGVVLSTTVPAAFARGEAAHTPLMIGGNSFEASLFGDLQDHPGIVLDRLGPRRDGAVALFGQGDPGKAAANIVTLAEVIEPDRYLARQAARVGTPAYLYYFSYVPEAIRGQVLGAGHGAEVAYVFGNLPSTSITRAADDHRTGPRTIPAATAADEAISRAMRAYWVAFARNGDPGDAGGPRWPAETAAHDALLEFGAGGVAVRQNFESFKLDLLAARAEAAGADARP
jgi:para-nitrobenzyl esterase